MTSTLLKQIEIDAGALTVGDEIRVRAGEAVPADGRVIEGASRVDESSMTGEPLARAVEPGDGLLAGSVNVDGPLWLRAERVGEQTSAAHVQRMFEEARSRQPDIQRAADRVASFFVPSVVLLAVALFCMHALRGTPTEGLFVALSILLISCPAGRGAENPVARITRSEW